MQHTLNEVTRDNMTFDELERYYYVVAPWVGALYAQLADSEEDTP